jgi:hypothetical protein
MSYKEMQPVEADRQLTEETIKAWRAKRAERLAKQKETDILEKQEKDMKSWLIAVFQEQKFEGMLIDQRITGLSTREVQIVEDRAAFIEYIYENEAIDLLQFRVNEGAIAERVQAGEVVPGTNTVDVNDLFDRKA